MDIFNQKHQSHKKKHGKKTLPGIIITQITDAKTLNQNENLGGEETLTLQNAKYQENKKRTSKNRNNGQTRPKKNENGQRHDAQIFTKHTSTNTQTCGLDLSPLPLLSPPARPCPRPSALPPAVAALSPSGALRQPGLGSPGCRTRPRGPFGCDQSIDQPAKESQKKKKSNKVELKSRQYFTTSNESVGAVRPAK